MAESSRGCGPMCHNECPTIASSRSKLARLQGPFQPAHGVRRRQSPGKPKQRLKARLKGLLRIRAAALAITLIGSSISDRALQDVNAKSSDNS